MKHQKSEALFEQATQVIPGGVNSPVRAFGSVGMPPVFVHHGQGAKIYDEDGNEYRDYIGSWGPLILGHSSPVYYRGVAEALAKGNTFGAPTAIEARGYTGRDKFIKFEGCYHGHSDALLVKSGSGTLTFGVPTSAGVTEGAAKDTLVATYNDLESVKTLFVENPGEIACVIVEPVAGNMGIVPPTQAFMEGLRAITKEAGALLIFDEVITGFRVAYGGAQEVMGIVPDLTTLGKIIGGGMPVGAFGGRRDIMEKLAPTGPVYQAGTLSGNPIAMHMGLNTLRYLKAHPEVYTHLDHLGERLEAGINQNIRPRASRPPSLGLRA